MKCGEYKPNRIIGDVHIFDVVYKNGDSRPVAKIGGPNEAEMFADSGAGKLLMHFLEHLGEFFGVQALAQITGLKSVSIPTYLGTLDSRFSHSSHYQMFSRKGGTAYQRIYGLVERSSKTEGLPVRYKSCSRKNSRKNNRVEDLTRRLHED